ncbi:MAG: response regulator [Alphaproteobacteria bacterium]|nr:response regulator [Alphaproteobacteria bacterium]
MRTKIANMRRVVIAMTQDRQLVRRILVIMALVFTCTLWLGYILVSGDRQIQRTDYWISHTYKTILQAEEFSAHVEGMISSQRAYVMTGQEKFFDEYNNRKMAISEFLATVSELVKDNRSQSSRIDELRQLFRGLTIRLEERAKMYKPVGVPEGFVNEVDVITNTKNDMLKINSAVLKEEHQILNNQIALLDEKKSDYFYTLCIGGILTAMAVIVFNIMLFHTQNRRHDAEQSLKDTEQRFALAIQGTNDGIFDWDIKNGKVFYSRQFFGMLGQDREAFIGTIDDFRNLIHPEDLNKVWQYIERYLRHELSEYSNSFRLRHENGRWVWVNSRAKAIFNRDGEPIRMVGANIDITYMKEYQEKLKSEKQMAERANRAKSDFLAHMSHEIRTPLTAISGIAEIFQKDRDSLNEKQKQLAKTLSSSTSTLKDLVSDILDFSKIESGELELTKENFGLDAVFQQVISIMSVNAKEKGLGFTFDYGNTKDTNFFGDKTRFRQILINLIGNAVKFTEKGSVNVTADIQEREGIKFLEVGVQDTGIGIAPENHSIIFERFKQADSSVSRRYGGTGLGLPISRNLAQIMGGSILLDSEQGKGSVFTLLLPMQDVNAPAGAKDSDAKILSQKLSDKIKTTLSGENRILMVEDYEGNIVVIGYILDEIGCSYDVARTGLEALNLWKDKHYDLILMDIQMPEMDGFTATTQIRIMEGEKDMPRTPIIGMTAHALIGDKDKCIAAGMDAYLPKPIVEVDLKTQILKYLDRNRKAA